MKPIFITVKKYGREVLVNVNKIEAVVADKNFMDTKTKIFFTLGADLTVTEPYEEVKKKIECALNPMWNESKGSEEE